MKKEAKFATPTSKASNPKYPLTKPETTIPASTQSASPGLDAKGLEEAFAIFYAESQKLEAQQIALQDKIDQLSDELQKSNQRLGILMNAIPAGVSCLKTILCFCTIPRSCTFCQA